MNNPHQIYSKADEFSDDQDLDRKAPVENDEASVEKERVKSLDETIDSHLCLVVCDKNSEKGVELHHNQEINWTL